NSAGDGRFRGGFGIEASFQLRDGDAYLTLLGDRGTAGAHGIEGGEGGQPADHDFHVDGKSFKAPHLTKIDRLYLRPGDGVDLRTPGGGGFGKASQRSAAARRDDAENGFLDNR
ncbi:MAG: hydantoinase B/oxoprolinase family protein, partial [Rhodospirillales bacterium]|nr:hydantoinase B/oxoprolinase family protein [Rhodospirillales bacterium]